MHIKIPFSSETLNDIESAWYFIILSMNVLFSLHICLHSLIYGSRYMYRTMFLVFLGEMVTLVVLFGLIIYFADDLLLRWWAAAWIALVCQVIPVIIIIAIVKWLDKRREHIQTFFRWYFS